MSNRKKIYTHLVLVQLLLVHCTILGNALQPLSEAIIPDEITLSQIFPAKDTGKISLTKETSIFYTLARSTKPTKAPQAVWINGGPGCSGLMGFFGEHGPYLHQTKSNQTSFRKNPYSQNQIANILYLEFPIGVGFSDSDLDEKISSYPTEFSTHGEIFVQFLQKFIEVYPEFHKTDFYITGESVGGQFAGAMSVALIKSLDSNPFVNFKGVSINNGWVDPHAIYKSFPGFALRKNLISYPEYFKALPVNLLCVFLLRFKLWEDFTQKTCFHSTDLVTGVPRNFDWYDFTVKRPENSKKDANGYDWIWLSEFMNSSEVKDYLGKNLGISGLKAKWNRCSGDIRLVERYEVNKSYAWAYDFLLARGLKVVLYYGLDDFMCNVDGSLDWIGDLDYLKLWEGDSATVFDEQKKRDEDWDFRFRNLYVYGVEGAGHMVGIKQPRKNFNIFEGLIS